LALVLSSVAARAQCVLPYALTNGTLSDATQLMADFKALANCISAKNATNSIQYNAGHGQLSGVGPLGNGQLVIGSTGTAPQANTIAPGAGIVISNGPGTISISSTNDVSGAGLYRQVMSDTPTSASTGLTTWLNQGSATVTDSAVGMCIDAPTTGTSPNLTGRYMAAPTAPYTITVLIAATRISTGYSGVGIGWYDGSAKLHVLSYSIYTAALPTLLVDKWNSVTSYNAADFTSPTNNLAQPIWLQISDDGTKVSFRFSHNGSEFLEVFSVAKSSGFLGASGYSNVIFFVDPRGSRTLGTVMSWAKT